MKRAATKHKATAADKHIGHNMQKLRLYKGLSQDKLAQVLGVSFQQVQKYESGVNRLSAAKLYELHQYFNVPLDYFFDGMNDTGTPDMALIDAPPAALSIFHKLRCQDDGKLLAQIGQIVDILCPPSS